MIEIKQNQHQQELITISEIIVKVTYRKYQNWLMSSQQQQQMFPSFGEPNSKSPTKNPMSKLGSGINSQNGGMKVFLENKIPKAIKLNNLNQIHSIHSSVFQQNSSITSEQNSLRNIVNSSYWNTTQQSILHQHDDLPTINPHSNTPQNIIKKPYKNKNIPPQQVSPLRQKISSIRSRSSSHLTVNHSHISNTSSSINKKPIFTLTQQLKPIQNNHQLFPQITKYLEKCTVKKQSQLKTAKLSSEDQVQKLFTEHFDRNFIKNLIAYMTKDWAKDEGSLLEGRKIQMLINIIISKFGSFNQIISDFLTSEFVIEYQGPVEGTEGYSLRETKLLTSILMKEFEKTFEQMKRLFEELIGKLPEEGIVEQQFVLDELKKSVLQIYDPKFTYSSAKMKERFKLYYEVYCTKRNSLQTQIKHKLKPQLAFINDIENYLSSYQKELVKLKAQITNLNQQKQHLLDLLNQKTTFKPIEINFQQLASLKLKAQQKIKQDFDQNIVQFHNKIHAKNADTIETLQDQNKQLKKDLQAKQKQKLYHINKLQDLLNSIPPKRDASTQIFNIPTSTTSKPEKSLEPSAAVSPHELGLYPNFLANIITPFTFNQKITSSLISIITIDKILYDYQPIKLKLPLMNFKHYIYQWFIVRTGSKKIAQILLKNFLYSIKKSRNKHKRFGIFNKICGFTAVRGKNLQQDIEHLFYQTNLAWYYLVKLALAYRKKLNSNPTGYHIFPPIGCEQIFKLSLRKGYELIEEFFTEEGIAVPEGLTQKIDHYAINQISKFKQHDEDWQKQSLQQIHILREMNFDVIAGFVIDYVASEKATTLESLIRSIHLKQEEQKSPIGYGEFEAIYRKYYKEKRYKIQLVYSKVCLCNMNDVLNAENMTPAILQCLEDETLLRNIFDKDQTLKGLLVIDKQSNLTQARTDKKTPMVTTTPNSYEQFKEKFFNQFYDFYDVTIMHQEIFRIIKSLIRKRLKKLTREQTYIENLLEMPKKQIVGETKKQPEDKKEKKLNEDASDEEEDESSEEEEIERTKADTGSLQRLSGERSLIEQKLEEWKKVQERIPHFASKILTIEQIIIHNMRKKEMFDGCEFAWRTLRDILVVISK